MPCQPAIAAHWTSMSPSLYPLTTWHTGSIFTMPLWKVSKQVLEIQENQTLQRLVENRHWNTVVPIRWYGRLRSLLTPINLFAIFHFWFSTFPHPSIPSELEGSWRNDSQSMFAFSFGDILPVFRCNSSLLRLLDWPFWKFFKYGYCSHRARVGFWQTSYMSSISYGMPY